MFIVCTVYAGYYWILQCIKNDKVFFLHIYMDSIKIHNVYMYTYTYLFIYRMTTLYKQDLCVTILWQHI
jgi:hypothetical protein